MQGALPLDRGRGGTAPDSSLSPPQAAVQQHDGHPKNALARSKGEIGCIIEVVRKSGRGGIRCQICQEGKKLQASLSVKALLDATCATGNISSSVYWGMEVWGRSILLPMPRLISHLRSSRLAQTVRYRIASSRS